MSTGSFDIANLDDNVFGSDFANDDGTTGDSNTPAGEQSADELDEEDDESAPPPGAAGKPQDQGKGGDRGDLNIALKQARESERALKAELASMRTQFSQLQTTITTQQQRDQQAAYDQQLREEASLLDAEDIPAFLQQKENERNAQLQAQNQQTNALRALNLSEQFARTHLEDFDAQIGKVLGTKEAPAPYARALVGWAATTENPAMALYELGKGFRTDAEVQVLVEAGVKQRLEELTRAGTNRNSPPPAPRLGSVPAASKPGANQDPLKGLKRGLASEVGSPDWHRSVNSLFDMTAE